MKVSLIGASLALAVLALRPAAAQSAAGNGPVITASGGSPVILSAGGSATSVWTVPSPAPRMTAVMRAQDTTFMPPPTEVRQGTWEAAPWMTDTAGPTDVGHIVGSAEVLGIGGAPTRSYFSLLERLYVVLPQNAPRGTGMSFQTIRIGEVFPGLGRPIIPTAIVRIEREEMGKATVARVVKQFAEIQPTDVLVPLDSLRIAGGVRPVAVANGPKTDVLWINGSPVLPALGRYLVLRATMRDGVRPGDQFTLYRPAAVGPNGEELPDEPLGVAQVVRVTAFGTTAMLIDIQHGGIQPGTPARLTARMP
jgi:hypothetical protein